MELVIRHAHYDKKLVRYLLYEACKQTFFLMYRLDQYKVINAQILAIQDICHKIVKAKA